MQSIHIFICSVIPTNIMEMLKKSELVFSVFHGPKGLVFFLLLGLFCFFKVAFITVTASKTLQFSWPAAISFRVLTTLEM